MARSPAAFLSYVRDDDDHDRGRLTEFRTRLEREVKAQTGESFPIFQDRNDIAWGQQWQERIEESLDGSTFLIPIVTPSFLKSPACRGEFERFLEREKKLKRHDLILPVLYIGTPTLSDPEKQKDDSIAGEIAKRQWVDWQDLRFEPWTSPDIGKRFVTLAVQIRDACERGVVSRPAGAGESGKVKSPVGKETRQAGASSAPSEPAGAERPGERPPPARKEPRTFRIDPFPGRGDFTSIAEGIQKAPPGARLLVSPGLYKQPLVLDKALEIVGDGPREEIVVAVSGADTLQFRTDFGRVANLTLRQSGGGEWFGIDVAQGRLELEDCDIRSESLACVAIHAGADPRIRRCAIHDGETVGVFVYDKGKGTLEDNDIFANATAGVAIATGGEPVLRRNRIIANKYHAIRIHEAGRGTFEDNDLRGNEIGAWNIAADCLPHVKRSGNLE